MGECGGGAVPWLLTQHPRWLPAGLCSINNCALCPLLRARAQNIWQEALGRQALPLCGLGGHGESWARSAGSLKTRGIALLRFALLKISVSVCEALSWLTVQVCSS